MQRPAISGAFACAGIRPKPRRETHRVWMYRESLRSGRYSEDVSGAAAISECSRTLWERRPTI
eukprot:1347602-Pyramimonas_sp.AAC.1